MLIYIYIERERERREREREYRHFVSTHLKDFVNNFVKFRFQKILLKL